VAKPEWGIKRICVGCGAKYYDMRKVSPVCPACGTEHNPELVLRSRRARIGDDEVVERDIPLAKADVDEADLAIATVTTDDDDIIDDDAVLEDDLDDDVTGEDFIENADDLDDDSR
jgi:uncharacterized protein (TIGR02300 family)